MLSSEEGKLEKGEWVIPVIQGHYGSFNCHIRDYQLEFFMMSRRSKHRSGTRFYNRGIDENANCANFIETEQIFVICGILSSFVMVSGSLPIFWEQKSQNSKIKLTRNK